MLLIILKGLCGFCADFFAADMFLLNCMNNIKVINVIHVEKEHSLSCLARIIFLLPVSRTQRLNSISQNHGQNRNSEKHYLFHRRILGYFSN